MLQAAKRAGATATADPCWPHRVAGLVTHRHATNAADPEASRSSCGRRSQGKSPPPVTAYSRRAPRRPASGRCVAAGVGDGYPTRLPDLPPSHDPATLQQAKLPVGAPVRSAHQVATGVQVPPSGQSVIRSSWCEPSRQRALDLGCLGDKSSGRNLLAGSLLMSHPPVDPTTPSRDWRHSGLKSSPRRPGVGRQARLGVRCPLLATMSTGRREQAITAIVALLMAEFEREAQQPALDAHGRGRVADGGIDQEG
jgi:hypothetical protein